MFFILLFLLCVSPACCADTLETTDNRWSESSDPTIPLLHSKDVNNCIIEFDDINPKLQNKILPRETWWIIAFYLKENAHLLAQLSKDQNDHLKCLVPHLVLPRIPSVLTILTCLNIVEQCEETYRILKSWGYDNSYFPAYTKQVEKLTNAEAYVRYSPVFRIWYDGLNRLDALRKIHHLGKPEQPRHPLLVGCSSFARDPLISTLNAAVALGLTAAGLLHFFGDIWPSYLHNIDAAQTKHLHDYQVALNRTTSDDFPQSLKNVHTYNKRDHSEGSYLTGNVDYYPAEEGIPGIPPIRLKEELLYGCYKKCKDWYTTGIIETEYIPWKYHFTFIQNAIFLPLDMCSTPNGTSPDYNDHIDTFYKSTSFHCGYQLADLWTPWLRENLPNLTTTMMSIPQDHLWGYFAHNNYPGIAKIKDQNTFIHIERSYTDDVLVRINKTAPYCIMPASIYTYDPVCIAREMALTTLETVHLPILVLSAWGATGTFVWMSFIILMIVGWCV